MAPVPDERPHYSGASPLDGGSDPVSLGGGGDEKFSPSGLEIGLIVGIVSLAVVSLIWLFFWRSRRNRVTERARGSSAAGVRGHEEELMDTTGLRIPTPISKDDRASTADKDDVSSIERPPCSHRRPAMNWPH